MKGEEKLMIKDIEVNIAQNDQAMVDPYKLFVLEPDKYLSDVIRYIKETFGLRSSKSIKGENHNTVLLCFDTYNPPGMISEHKLLYSYT